jgi:tetratricopeptide (TPR) repeat protein
VSGVSVDYWPVNRSRLLSLLSVLSLWGGMAPASIAQVPHTVAIDFVNLRQQGLALAQDAARRAEFQQYDIALQHAELATQMVTDDFRVWALVADINLRLDKPKEAIPALQQARKLAPNEPSLFFALGSAAFRQAEYNESINYIQSGLKIKPNVPGAIFDLGNAYYRLNKLTEAVASFEKAVAQKKDFWEAMNNIGLVRYEQGQIDRAVAGWTQSIEMATKRKEKAAEPQLALAVVTFTKGNVEKAYSEGEAALKVDGRYGNIDFLKEQLWGDRLLADTKKFLETPRMKAAILQYRPLTQGGE